MYRRTTSSPYHLTSGLLPDGIQKNTSMEVFAIGDVHGQGDMLEELLAEIAAMRRTAPQRCVVFLGDLIDRGPASVKAMSLAYHAAEITGADEVYILAGNHELLLIDSILSVAPELGRDFSIGNQGNSRTDVTTASDVRDRLGQSYMTSFEPFMLWWGNGGSKMFSEVARQAVDDETLDEDLREVLRAPIAGYPDEQMMNAFVGSLVRGSSPCPPVGQTSITTIWPVLLSLRSHLRIGNILFVHAGIAPKRPIAACLDIPWHAHISKNAIHWAWIREHFLTWQGGWNDSGTARGPTDLDSPDRPDTLVVHGHTPCTRTGARSADLSTREGLVHALDQHKTHARLNLDIDAAAGLGVAAAHFTGDRRVRLLSVSRELG